MYGDDCPIKIKTELIPDHVRDRLVLRTFMAVYAYFQQPGVQEKFDAWLREEERKGVVTPIQ